MGELPETTTEDLLIMGITPEMIRQVMEKAMTIEGDTAGFWFPDDDGRRARNHALSDWKAIEDRPSEIINENKYEQGFSNFDGDEPLDTQFNHTSTTTQGIEYNQTQSFDVNVNASIPIGTSGAMLGFGAGMSTQEVHSKSWSKTEDHAVSFGLTVPAGEGRLVTETTTESSTDTVYESKIQARGTVGIYVDPAWYKPNEIYYFEQIENVFPDKFAVSKIIRTAIDTSVNTTITKIEGPKGSNGKAIKGDIITYGGENTRSLSGLQDFSYLHPQIGFALKPKEPNTKLKLPRVTPARQTLRFDFDRPEDPIPPEDRATKTKQFRTKLSLKIKRNLVPPGISEPIYIPDEDAPDEARITVEWDQDKMSRVNLQLTEIAAANLVDWEGKYWLHFS